MRTGSAEQDEPQRRRPGSPRHHSQRHGPGGVHRGAEGHPGLSSSSLSSASPSSRGGQLDTSALITIRQRLSHERLAPYDRLANNDHRVSLLLYEWNIDISSAFFSSLHILEVVLRNALSQQLALLHLRHRQSGQWYEQPSRLLTTKACEEVAKARRRLQTAKKTETPGRLIAELPFGFWRYLTAARYTETLWRPALRRAFDRSRPLSRRFIAVRLARLHELRNRIAHHEPIHHRELHRDWLDLLCVAGALCGQVRTWILRTTRVPEVLAARPQPPDKVAGG